MIFIPGNVPSSKNSTWAKIINGRRIVLPSKQTVEYKKNTKDYWELYKKEFQNQLDSKPYKIGFKFIRGSKHKFDYVNPLQTIQDEMVKHNWLEDDTADELLPIFLPYEYDKNNPGVYIEVL